MDRAISSDCWARWAYTKLSDRQIEKIFDMLDSGGLAEALLYSPDASFDWHSKLLLTGLEYGLGNPWRKPRNLVHRGDVL